MDGIWIFILCTVTMSVILIEAAKVQNAKMTEAEAYAAGYMAHANLDTSPEDEQVLEVMRDALKLYIRHHGYYRKGDVQKLKNVSDFRELQECAWSMTIVRKERGEM